MRSLHPPQIRIAIVCDNFSPHLSARKDKRVEQWAAASNAEIAWRNRHTADPACAGSSNGQPQPDRAVATE
jgi:hypothetical protein